VVSDESGETTNVVAGSLFRIVNSAFELERFERVVAVKVAKFGDNVGAGMHDPEMVGDVTKVEGAARIEKAVETDVG